MERVVVASTFEGGFQPAAVASALAHLTSNGIEVEGADTWIEPLADEQLAKADLVAISVPLFDSLRGAADLAQRAHRLNPRAHVTFFGQYATVNYRRLAGPYGDSAIVGEWELPLTALSQRVLGGDRDPRDMPGLYRPGMADVAPFIPPRGEGAAVSRLPPARHLLPPLTRYPQPQVETLCGESKVVGATELTRGCHHRCLYCSVFAAYHGRVILAPDDLIMADVRNMVAAGMTHLTFADAEFLNVVPPALRIVRAIHQEFPQLTMDFTARVDHILESREAVAEMAKLGVRFITSAMEFPSERVLQAVAKEVKLNELDDALGFLEGIGVRANPTFVMFNPWVTFEEILEFTDFVVARKLDRIIDPIQYETRLHLYKGSPLLDDPFIRGLKLTENEFHYEWSHPDDRVDELFRDCQTPPKPGTMKRCCLKC